MLDFLGVAFKYFFITLCCIFIFKKLNSIKPDYKQIVVENIFSMATATAVFFTRESSSVLSLFFIVFFTTALLKILYKRSFNKTLAYTIISVAISFITYFFATLIIGTIIYYQFKGFVNNDNLLSCATNFSVGLFQLLTCNLLFRIKRLKKGIATYESKLTSDSGIFISLSLLLIASLFNSGNNYTVTQIILFCVLPIGMLLFFWWRNHIKNIYLEKVYKRNIEILENTVSQQKTEIEMLRKQNDELSKIIHKDNKVIPAMNMAVEEILMCQSADEQKRKAKSLLTQLKAMTCERKGIVTEYESKSKTLASTGVFSVDASLNYLLAKAKEKDVFFDLSVTNGIAGCLDKCVSENDLNTLILDLGENAIIAASFSEKKNVFVMIGSDNKKLCLYIYDSGSYFDADVIANLGKKRITTHKSSGGSGIGLMTTFSLLHKYSASLKIDETVQNESYSKCVSLIFDREGKIFIKSNRKEIADISQKRNEFIFEV